jgi:alkylation response protein AidB-like acyl-CoA dehydrogenase
MRRGRWRAITRSVASRSAPRSRQAARRPLAGLEAEFSGALLAFFVVELLGRSEAGPQRRRTGLLRVLTPLAKLTTAKQAVAVASMIESFGSAGHVEDSGLPLLLRDAQVLPIWEGDQRTRARRAACLAGSRRN